MKNLIEKIQANLEDYVDEQTIQKIVEAIRKGTIDISTADEPGQGSTDKDPE